MNDDISGRTARDDGILGVVLAGGQSRRMGGGDKGLLPLGGATVLAQVIARLRPQVSRLLLNANGDPARFAGFELPVAGDTVQGFAGPLAGVLAGMEWSREHLPRAEHVVTIAGDTPFLPLDLVARLAEAATTAEIAVAATRGRSHPVAALWRVSLAADLRRALVDEGIRRMTEWMGRYRLAVVDFPVGETDPFFNINQPADLAEAERIWAKLPQS